MKRIKVIGTIHEETEGYTYKMLFDAVESYEPDMIGVEIRPQDMIETNDELIQYYPKEMVLAKKKYENRIKVFGFDWRGWNLEDVPMAQGRSLTPSLWTVAQSNDVVMRFIKERREGTRELFRDTTMEEYQQGKTDELLREYDDQLMALLEEEHITDLMAYYKEREKQIQETIWQQVLGSEEKKILILTGIAHRKELMAFLHLRTKTQSDIELAKH